MALLDKYLLRSLLTPLFIGLGVFVVIMMSETALKLGQILTGMRTPAVWILEYLGYSLPRAVAWSLPVGVLVGVAMVTTTMTRNGEATAARAGGVSLLRIWLPFVGVGLVGSVASFALEEYVVPGSTQRRNEVMRDMTHTQPILRSRSEQAFRDRDGRLIYVGHMNEENNTLERVMVLTEDARGRLASLTAAKWAEVTGDVWVLREGVEMRFDTDGQPYGEPRFFETAEVRLWRALQDYYLDQRSEFEMTTRELREAAETMEIGGLDAQRMRVRLQFKYSIPFGCLVFVLVAAPLGRRYARLGSFAGIVISILVVFLYNGVRSWGLAFGLTGDLPPVIAAWTQNAVFGALGLWLMAGER